MTTSEQNTFREIFDKHYDNDNKICTRRSLFEQFKDVNREWLQQKRKDAISRGFVAYEVFLDELLEELEK